jgi:membrane-associated phospholipid phosphatase
MAFQADRPPTRLALVVSGGVVTVCAALFLLIAEDVLDGGGLISRDELVLTWFVDHRTERSITAARWVSTVGGFPSLCIMGVVLGLWLWSRRTGPMLAVAPLISLLVGGLAAALFKAVFGRERPPVVLHATTVGVASFPSAHAADAAAFFVAASMTLALAVVRRRWVKVVVISVGAALAGIVGLSRLVLAVHWLSDVVAGWALGTAVATTVVMLAWFVTSARYRKPPASSGRETPGLHAP